MNANLKIKRGIYEKNKYSSNNNDSWSINWNIRFITFNTIILLNNIDEISNKYNIKYYRNDIADTLIRKARNKKEYKEYNKYVSEFLDKTDYQKILYERYIEELYKEQELNKLKLKRKVLSTLLYNLNEKLQEEVPGKTKIKNIKFK